MPDEFVVYALPGKRASSELMETVHSTLLHQFTCFVVPATDPWRIIVPTMERREEVARYLTEHDFILLTDVVRALTLLRDRNTMLYDAFRFYASGGDSSILKRYERNQLEQLDLMDEHGVIPEKVRLVISKIPNL